MRHRSKEIFRQDAKDLPIRVVGVFLTAAVANAAGMQDEASWNRRTFKKPSGSNVKIF